MFKNIILLILFVSLSTNAQIKSGEIIYKVKTNSLINKDADKDVKDFIEKSDQNLSEISFLFKFNENESLFINEEKMNKDSDEYFYKMALASTGASKKSWYQNNEENLTLKQYDFMGKVFLISSELKSLKWNITNESKMIVNLRVLKASCERTKLGSKGPTSQKLEVWFAPEVPVIFGPLGLGGLPGLIMEVNVGRMTFYIENLKLYQEKNLSIDKLTEGEKVSSEDFYSLAGESINDFKDSN